MRTIWRNEVAALYAGVDAQAVADEISGIGDSATPAQIVERAKDESSELHKCFTWDDAEAAEKYRLCEARRVIRCLVREQQPTDEKDTPPVRVFYKTNNGEGYKHVEYVLRRDDEYQALLARAMDELRSFKRKYSMLEELREILDLIA